MFQGHEIECEDSVNQKIEGFLKKNEEFSSWIKADGGSFLSQEEVTGIENHYLKLRNMVYSNIDHTISVKLEFFNFRNLTFLDIQKANWSTRKQFKEAN